MGPDASGCSAYGTLLHIEERPLETRYGEFRAHLFSNIANGRFAVVLSCGDVTDSSPLLARVHSSCVTSETFGACDCDCAGQLDEALRAIASAGRGVVFYLMQEGRGAGFVAKARDRMIVQASRHRVTTFEAYERMGLGSDQRRYDEVAFACHMLGIEAPLRLLSNNPEKVAALEGAKLVIDCVVPLCEDASPYNLHYLASKSRSGHTLDDESGARSPAELPEEVSYFDPYPLPSHPHLLRIASYLLPIRISSGLSTGFSTGQRISAGPSRGPAGVGVKRPSTAGTDARGGESAAPLWFWLHLYVDRALRQERVVLTYQRDANAQPLVRVLRESLLERFPLREDRGMTCRWRDVVAEIADRGAGCAAFLPLELGIDAAEMRDAPEPDAAAALLLDHHLAAFDTAQ